MVEKYHEKRAILLGSVPNSFGEEMAKLEERIECGHSDSL
jgi:hypothetical protein